MRRLGSVLVLLALAGCDDAPNDRQPADSLAEASASAPASSASPTPAAMPAARPAPANLTCEWRVAGIDGRDFNEAYGLALSADDREIWWEPRCAGMIRGYTITGNGVRFGRAPSRGPEPKPGKPVTDCTIAPPARLAEVMRALDSATSIIRTPSNSIEISGGGHSLTLFSQ